MTDSSSRFATYEIEHLSHRDIERLFGARPFLILPVGALEPVGARGGIGEVNRCTAALARGISARLEVACAPLLAYGCCVPFMSFAGVAGAKVARAAGFICDLLRCWRFQGVRAVILLDGSSVEGRLGDEIGRRLPGRTPGILHLRWQVIPELGAAVKGLVEGIEYGGSEYAVLSMAAYLGARPRRSADRHTDTLPPEQTWQTWKKRGADPEKYRKLFPRGSSSEIASQFDPAAGEWLFEIISEALQRKIVPFFEASHA